MNFIFNKKILFFTIETPFSFSLSLRFSSNSLRLSSISFFLSVRLSSSSFILSLRFSSLSLSVNNTYFQSPIDLHIRLKIILISDMRKFVFFCIDLIDTPLGVSVSIPIITSILPDSELAASVLPKLLRPISDLIKVKLLTIVFLISLISISFFEISIVFKLPIFDTDSYNQYFNVG
jgi:hypothetical protein